MGVKIFTVELTETQAAEIARKIGAAPYTDPKGKEWVVSDAKAVGGKLILRMLPRVPGTPATGSASTMSFLSFLRHTEFIV